MLAELIYKQTQQLKFWGAKVLHLLFEFLRKIKIPGMEGLSLFDVLEMYTIGIFKGALTMRAGSISYSFFMALFPFLLFVINLLPYVPFIDYQEDFLPFLESVFPPNTLDVFQSTTANIFAEKRGGLLTTSFFFSMFLMANGVNSLFSGFQESYHTTINVNFIKQYITAFGVALLLALFLFLTVIAIPIVEIYVVQNLADYGLIASDLVGIKVAKYIIFTLMFYIVIATFYHFGSAEKTKNKFFTSGAVLSTLLFVVTTYLFGIYVNNFAKYNELYGSIGAILILMLYIWLNSNILLLGYELNGTLRRLREKAEIKKKS